MVIEKAVAAGLDEVIHEALSTKALVSAGAAKIATTKVATTKIAAPIVPMVNTVGASGTIWTGKGLSLGLGLGLGAWGPLLLTAGLGYLGYRYYKHKQDSFKDDEGFMED